MCVDAKFAQVVNTRVQNPSFDAYATQYIRSWVKKQRYLGFWFVTLKGSKPGQMLSIAHTSLESVVLSMKTHSEKGPNVGLIDSQNTIIGPL